ncbi:MAG TPA: hypothetical protein VMV86_04205 [Methanosarcinales archaeon]|nr:hypothetical protein [Methanosarcinales archaeon]
MAKKAFNYEFKMYLEGIKTPFKSAQITNTPNGVEASINIYSCKEALSIKPKTAVQIFYREWVFKGSEPAWRLMFDGFFSSFYKTDQAPEHRTISLICRDFRMDIRKSPAALSFQSKNDLAPQVRYNSFGVNRTFVVKGVTKKSNKGKRIHTYGNSGLDDISETLAYIAGTAFGKGITFNKNGISKVQSDFGTCLKPTKNDIGDGGLFLDSLVRGIWLEAVGGTTINAFMNKRIRVDKRIFIPTNAAGYNFWKRKNAGLQIGGYMMGNAQFTSVEATIMRLAGLFASRPYACSTPSLIPISGDSKSSQYVIADGVRKFLTDTAELEFGAKYILNETMLLPPLEFTAPPNCNLILPPMCDKIVWQYDMDADFTRGYFSTINVFPTKRATDQLLSKSYQVPNALFGIAREEGDAKDVYGRSKPPLTLEERYKGVKVFYNRVEWLLAAKDAASSVINTTFNKKTRSRLNKEIEGLQKTVNEVETINSTSSLKELTPQQIIEMKASIKDKKAALAKTRYNTSKSVQEKTDDAIKRHALLKYLNVKYSGRVVTAQTSFNPYIMCGFPGAVITDDNAYGAESINTIIGMVQQVTHQIFINPNSADAMTSAVLNNARFEDEPTDIDEFGNPLWMKATNTLKAEINPNSLEYVANDYFVPTAKAEVTLEPEGDPKTPNPYDLKERQLRPDYIYAKDLLTLSSEAAARGESNRIYVDSIYEPNKIAKFYTDVLRHNSESLMIGSDTVNGRKIKFMYDTVHEALVQLRAKHPELLKDYTSCMKYISRNICSADAFYQGILGLSFKKVTRDGDDTIIEYVSNQDNFDDTTIYDEYFGVTTKVWDSGSIDSLKASGKGIMTAPGECSSIRESMPITALIKERKEAVRTYINEATKQARGK